MTKIANLYRWLISIISFLHSVFFLLNAYFVHWYYVAVPAQWLVALLLMGLLSLWVAYSVFSRHRTAKYLAALLFSGVLVWFTWAVVAARPFQLLALVLLLPPAIVLGLLFIGWKNHGGDRVEKLA